MNICNKGTRNGSMKLFWFAREIFFLCCIMKFIVTKPIQEYVCWSYKSSSLQNESSFCFGFGLILKFFVGICIVLWSTGSVNCGMKQVIISSAQCCTLTTIDNTTPLIWTLPTRRQHQHFLRPARWNPMPDLAWSWEETDGRASHAGGWRCTLCFSAE
jgi:hypothetical protein